MCSSRQILWSLLLLSVVEVGLGVASMVLGAVGISGIRGEQKPQQGDASPVWSGLCFVRALSKSPDSAMHSVHLAAMTLACLGISSCTLSAWLTCRLASSEQQRMFLEREHSLHHSHEMAEK
ncbi:hypothetical protein CRUP_023505, partial [Coryphaenoides rupestris]